MLLTWPATAVPSFRRRIIGRPCIGPRGGLADSGIRDLAVDRNIGRRRAIAGPPAGTHLMPQEGADGEQQSRADNKGRSERCQIPERCFLLLPGWLARPGESSRDSRPAAGVTSHSHAPGGAQERRGTACGTVHLIPPGMAISDPAQCPGTVRESGQPHLVPCRPAHPLQVLAGLQ